MELEHYLRLKIDGRDGLIALAIIVAGLVVFALGMVALTSGDRQGAGGEIAVDVRARHGFDQAQQGGVEIPGAGRLDDHMRRGRPAAHVRDAPLAQSGPRP